MFLYQFIIFNVHKIQFNNTIHIFVFYSPYKLKYENWIVNFDLLHYGLKRRSKRASLIRN